MQNVAKWFVKLDGDFATLLSYFAEAREPRRHHLCDGPTPALVCGVCCAVASPSWKWHVCLEH